MNVLRTGRAVVLTAAMMANVEASTLERVNIPGAWSSAEGITRRADGLGVVAVGSADKASLVLTATAAGHALQARTQGTGSSPVFYAVCAGPGNTTYAAGNVPISGVGQQALIHQSVAGATSWSHAYGGFKDELLREIAYWSDGSPGADHVVAVGTQVQASNDKQGFLLQINATTHAIETKRTFGQGGEDNFTAVVHAGAGEIIGGNTQSFGPTKDAWLLRRLSDDTMVWARRLDTGSAESVEGLVLASDGLSVIVTGDIGVGGCSDAFIASVDVASGAVNWHRRFGTAYWDHAAAVGRLVQPSEPDRFVVVGTTDQSGCSGTGSPEAWYSVFDEDGVLMSSGVSSTPGSAEGLSSVTSTTTAAPGNVIAAGRIDHDVLLLELSGSCAAPGASCGHSLALTVNDAPFTTIQPLSIPTFGVPAITDVTTGFGDVSPTPNVTAPCGGGFTRLLSRPMESLAVVSLDRTADGGAVALVQMLDRPTTDPVDDATFIVVRLDAAGDMLWSRDYTLPPVEAGDHLTAFPSRIKIAADGGFFVVGEQRSTDSRGFVLKADALGMPLAAGYVAFQPQQVPSEASVALRGVLPLDDGCVITGFARGSSRSMTVVMRLDATLTPIWRKRYGREAPPPFPQTDYNDYQAADVLQADNHVVVVGSRTASSSNNWLGAWFAALEPGAGSDAGQAVFGMPGSGLSVTSAVANADGAVFAGGISGQRDFVMGLSPGFGFNWCTSVGDDGIVQALAWRGTCEIVAAGKLITLDDAHAFGLSSATGSVSWARTFGSGPYFSKWFESVTTLGDESVLLGGEVNEGRLAVPDAWFVRTDLAASLPGCDATLVDSTSLIPLSYVDIQEPVEGHETVEPISVSWIGGEPVAIPVCP